MRQELGKIIGVENGSASNSCLFAQGHGRFRIRLAIQQVRLLVRQSKYCLCLGKLGLSIQVSDPGR